MEMETSCEISQSSAQKSSLPGSRPCPPQVSQTPLLCSHSAFCSPNTILIMPDGNLIFLLAINRLLADGHHVYDTLEFQIPVLSWPQKSALAVTVECLSE